MPSKKKKYNARFPAGRIKKIMQTDEEVGKVAQAVPVIISRTLELFVESLLTKTLRITNARNAKTLSPSHMKQCIISESRFDFLRDLVKNIPDIGVNEEQLSGSETGYDPVATPSSSSTTSSNGGGDVPTTVATPGTSSGLSLQRSESYTPVTVNYAGTLPIKAPIQPPMPQQQQQVNSLKRTLNHVGFYKEISLEETGSGSNSSSSSTGSHREPPPKLTRLHSAPAATITTSTKASSSSSIPFKIDILPTLPAAKSAMASSSQPRGAPATAPASSSNYKITYKFEPLKEAAAPKATGQQPVFKLDYSNVKLPMTALGNPSQKPSQSTATRHYPLQQHQPTIKIDLSSITNYGSKSNASSASSPSVVVKQQVPSATPPTTPLSAASSSSGVSSNSGSGGSGSRNPYIFSTGGAASSSTSSGSTAAPASVLAPVYSSVSSSIPGMDEDYDDI